MSENLILALQLTLVGMGVVFAAIILLGAVMAILVRLAADKPETAEDLAPAELISAAQEAEALAQVELARRRRAAAAAVAVALAQQTDSTEPHEFPLPPAAIVTAWQAVMRTRILNKRGPTR
jgi:Na+-transporting methylmalonyl-CoA/oxaloacetate decarboxylase gamma subunit